VLAERLALEDVPPHNGCMLATAENHDALVGRRLALAGICASALLGALNIAVGMLTGSTSVVATGVEFAGDVLASTIVFLGMVVAVRPADEDHPYGHGRVETLSAFVVGIVLALGGAGICWNSLEAVGASHATPGVAAVVVLLVAIAVRGVMSGFKFRVGRRIRSAALVADGWNDTVDILAASVALTAVVLAMYNGERFLAVDHYGGFAVGVIVILTGLRVLRDASLDLMDTMPKEDMVERVRSTAAAVPGVEGVHKLYARKTGLQYHIDLHVEVAPHLTVVAAHMIAGQVRGRIREEIPWVADVLVHVEPGAAVDV
jgi:cation diffusion facilitator family transporter